MTNEQFRSWKEHMYFTFETVAASLGLSLRTVKAYAADARIPMVVELACCELWRRQNEKRGERNLREHNFAVILNTALGQVPNDLR
jgi:hypothetical protein